MTASSNWLINMPWIASQDAALGLDGEFARKPRLLKQTDCAFTLYGDVPGVVAKRALCYKHSMEEEPPARRYGSLDDMKADEYRYWQSRPAHERLDAVEEMIQTAYALKGWEIAAGCTKTTKTFCPPSMPMALNTSLSEAYAVICHAQPRFTKDIDLFIKADSANARATYAALAEFGAPLQGIRPEDFTDRKQLLSIWT